MPEFSINEYVWDKVRKAPAIIVGTDLIDGPYTVAEIVSKPGGQVLGRVGIRSDDDLCRYVKVVMPEGEATLLLGLLASGSIGTEEMGIAMASFNRINEQVQKRGIEWNP